MVKKPENMICYVNAGAGKLNPSDLVKLFHGYSILPSLVILFRVYIWIIFILYFQPCVQLIETISSNLLYFFSCH